MSDYKLYIYGGSGHIVLAYDFQGPDDWSALEESKKHSGEGTLEVWQRARFVARIDQALTAPEQ